MPHLGGGLHRNTKTGLSVDFSTVCRRMLADTPCVYCYVHRARENGFCGKEVIKEVHYNGFVSDLSEEQISDMNSLGGIRMFAYGDYFEKFDSDYQKFLDDAESRGLCVKAVTKETDFVDKFADHDALTTTHLSVDNLKGSVEGRSPVTHEEASVYRASKDGVQIRAVVLDYDDLEYFSDWVDVLTLNHALWSSDKGKTCYLFSRDERKEISGDYPGMVCAAGPSGKCYDCPTKCGVDTCK